jgi:uncharacterized protein with predicted RNA binding PUA domain
MGFHAESGYPGSMDDADRHLLTRVADYQFGRGAGAVLFPAEEALEVTHTGSGRPRQVRGPRGRLATYGTAGRLTLGVAGGASLHDGLPTGDYRVVVGDESEPYVRDGRNVFAKFVTEADPAIRPRDEVLVVHADGPLLAVGRASLSGIGMTDFETGMAVRVRDSIES